VGCEGNAGGEGWVIGAPAMTAAVAHGWDVCLDFWQLIAIEVVGPGCCGGGYSFATYTHFDADSVILLDWAMTEILAEIPIGEGIALWRSLYVDDAGFRQLPLGFRIDW